MSPEPHNVAQRFNSDKDYAEKLNGLELKAKTAGSGVWAFSDSVSPSEYRKEVKRVGTTPAIP
ncbi:hypothetical protein [Marinobacter sp. ELB17]|uniref:hypothetical protein n=1 Tax=Marinobacter sp. ELB17 TaxID=270374 RepID=UPI0012F47F1B|nr:hypothetical protein [Marinobacter sp. ELB17]